MKINAWVLTVALIAAAATGAQFGLLFGDGLCKIYLGNKHG